MQSSQKQADANTHAAHRPPAPPPTSFGNFYPRGDIIAPVADFTTAENIAQDLRSGGFPDGDVDVLENAFTVRAADEVERRRGILGRLGAIFGDEHFFAEEFAELARTGHAFLIVHAPSADAILRAGTVLGAHGVRGAKHYGHFLVTDI
jgi:hypothetical protein